MSPGLEVGSSEISRLLLLVAGMLVGGTLVRLVRWGRSDEDLARERLASLATWWVLFAVFATAVSVGATAVVVLVGTGLVLACRELAGMEPSAGLLPPTIVAAAGLAVTVGLSAGPEPTAGLLGPAALGGMGIGVLLRWSTRSSARWRVGWWLHGGSTVGLGFPAVGALAFLPRDDALAWLAAVVVLTELNDIAQAFWGRMIGRRPLTPRLSPHKTREGFLGGVGSTVVGAMAVSLVLDLGIPGGLGGAAIAGAVVSVVGLAGDLAMSSLKRRARIKDSGTLLPGQGGLLDRLDSLTVTAPVALVWLTTSGAA